MQPSIAELLQLSVLIALGFLAAAAFYESMSTRDVLVGRVMRFARRRTTRRTILASSYVATVGLGIPMLVLLWTFVLELALVAIASADRLGSFAMVAVAVVAAARILAYVRERTSHELAKAIPLAFAFILLTGGALRLDENLARIVEEPDRSELTGGMVMFLIALEIVLRVLTDGSHALLARIRASRGETSDLGIWRTIWAAMRRSTSVEADARDGASPS
jgi:hypothetical protein